VEPRHYQLLEYLPDGLVFYQVIKDNNGKPVDGIIVDVNPAFEEITGWAKEKLAGEKVNEVLPKALGDNHPWMGLWEVAPHPGNNRYERYSYYSNCWYEVTVCNSGPGMVAEIYRDITQRKQMEDTINENEKRYRLLVEHAGDGIAVAQGDYFKFANPKAFEILECAPEMLYRTPFIEFVHPEDRSLVSKKYTRRLNGKEVEQSYTVRIVSASGRVKWVDLNGVVLEWDKQPASLVFFRDVTERKQAEEALALTNEKLQEVDRLKDEFLGTLSHEIRNPLATIMMALPLLDQSEPKQSKKAKEIISRQTSHLSRLVDDLLEVTRVTQNKIELKKSKIELNRVVRQSIEDYQAMFIKKGIKLIFQPASVELYVMADSSRISQVIGNLLHNAVKYTQKDGFTLVALAEDTNKQQATIRIEDNGAGISENMLPHLFEPFTHGEYRNSDLGMGLALVKGLLEMHGGSVDVYSEGPGKGSVFTIRLPLVV